MVSIELIRNRIKAKVKVFPKYLYLEVGLLFGQPDLVSFPF